MVPLRNGPKAAEIASFGLAILIYVLTPTQTGEQDFVAAQPTTIAAPWRERLIASPFGTIHAATFSLPRPIGTAIPEQPLVRLASLGTASEAYKRNAPAVQPDEIAAAMHFEPFPEYDISLSLELDPKLPAEDPVDLADLDPT